jgi:tRNA-Thr(GGU) m(6)t(6)A37 methyltransferase TsaA
MSAVLMQINPIGIFKSKTTTKSALPRQGTLGIHLQGEIEIFSNYVDGIRDLKGIQRIWIIFGFHRNKNWKPMVLPPTSKKKRSVFSTRSPYRPNFLGLTCCEVLRIQKNYLVVEGADLLDQTPIYDIKPYLPYADSFPKSRTGWIEKEEKQRFKVVWARSLLQIRKNFEKENLWNSLHSVEQQLSFHPTDSKRKRVKKTKVRGVYVFSYRYLRWKFKIHRAQKKITITGLQHAAPQDLTNLKDLDSMTREDRVAREIIESKK